MTNRKWLGIVFRALVKSLSYYLGVSLLLLVGFALLVGVLKICCPTFDPKYVIIVLLLFIFILFYFGALKSIVEDEEVKTRRLLIEQKKEFEKERERTIAQLEREKRDFNLFVQNEKAALADAHNKVEALLKSESPFKESARISADILAAFFGERSKYLRNKYRPAKAAAKEVAQLKKLIRQVEAENKDAQYRIEFILSAFPEIREYVNSDEDLISLANASSYEEVEETRDRAKDYLSKEEWDLLTVTQRNQLALDRYVAGRKSHWQIGRDFELACAFQLEKRGCFVFRNGIKSGFNDMGRDLIACSTKDNKHIWYIVQCKYWGAHRTLRENVIFQLYGTTISFELEKLKKYNLFSDSVVPVLAIPSSTELSETAKTICCRLGIKIWVMDDLEFPRIKCNINGSDKIYHLPFDQQYDRTEIKNNGECYAYTVEEAERKGFRRAKRHAFISENQ